MKKFERVQAALGQFNNSIVKWVCGLSKTMCTLHDSVPTLLKKKLKEIDH